MERNESKFKIQVMLLGVTLISALISVFKDEPRWSTINLLLGFSAFVSVVAALVIQMLENREKELEKEILSRRIAYLERSVVVSAGHYKVIAKKILDIFIKRKLNYFNSWYDPEEKDGVSVCMWDHINQPRVDYFIHVTEKDARRLLYTESMNEDELVKMIFKEPVYPFFRYDEIVSSLDGLLDFIDPCMKNAFSACDCRYSKDDIAIFAYFEYDPHSSSPVVQELTDEKGRFFQVTFDKGFIMKLINNSQFDMYNFIIKWMQNNGFEAFAENRDWINYNSTADEGANG